MDNFSVNAAEELFSEFPEWRKLARTELDDSGAAFLVVEVAAPPESGAKYGLSIDTSNQEVTVGFDHYHCHFDGFTGDGDHLGTRAALNFIRQILSERIGILSWWQGDTWCGSSQIAAGEVPRQPTWSTAAIDRMRVRSWNGTLNHDGAI